MPALIQIILFACATAAIVYVLGFAAITRRFWEGFLQAPARLQPCGSRHPNNRWLWCALHAGHSGRLCQSAEADTTWEPAELPPPRPTLLSALRRWVGELVACANCCGFWTGVGLSAALPLPIQGWLCAPLGGVLGMTLGAAVFGAMLRWRAATGNDPHVTQAIAAMEDVFRPFFPEPPSPTKGPKLTSLPPEPPHGAA